MDFEIISTASDLPSPQKISRIRETVPKFLEMLGSDDSDFDRFGLGLVTSMVTSNVRGLKFEGAKERTLLK